MKSIVYSGGHWSPNIGNAFFNLGILHALRAACPNAAVHFMADPPGWFWGSQRSAPNVLLDDVLCDYVVISGPLLCREFVQIWSRTLEKQVARGTKVLLLSAGCMRYDEQEYREVLPLIEKIRPYLLITRDAATYDRWHAHVEHAHNGICFAFFSSDVVGHALEFEGRDINLCFDKGHDYDVLLKFRDALSTLLDTGEWKHRDAETASLARSRAASRITQFHGHRVVRPHHAPNPFLTRRLKSAVLGYRPFAKPNTLAADIPHSYLQQYRRAPLTISERVHACVPALAFGNHAWLISRSPRSLLFDRVGVPDAVRRPVKADMDMLDEEKRAMIEVIRSVVAA